MSQKHLSETRFSELGLPDQLLSGIQSAGFEFCTPIQAQSLPHLLANKDIAGQAQTGTGKTAAFLIATFSRLINQPENPNRRKNQPLALILAPTRELAIQIHKDAIPLNETCQLKLGLAYGGVDYEKQRNQLEKGVDILIGTPGRLIDYHKQRVFDLKAIQALVLDEADRMFDLGFIKDLRFLLRRCTPPEKRLSMLFSATLSFRVMELAYEYMNNAVKVEVKAETVTADRVKQTVFYPANDEKIPLLLGLIKALEPERSIVFVNTKRAAETIVAWLLGNDHTAIMLSGDVPQKKRQRLLEEFVAGKHGILVATDVAARGLHIPEVSHVFNYDLPQIAEDYVHRIGRTARAGASGQALSLACEDTSFYLPDIEEYVGQKIPLGQVSDYLLTDLKPPEKISRPKRKQDGHRHSSHKKSTNNNRPRSRNNRRRRNQPKTSS